MAAEWRLQLQLLHGCAPPCALGTRLDTETDLVAPVGASMNSWKTIGAPECSPPLITLKKGMGSVSAEAAGRPASVARYACSGSLAACAPARLSAMDTARMALAPSFAFVHPFSVCEPSSFCTIRSSAARCASTSWPTSAGASTLLMLTTACVTPLPWYAAPPSRSSSASKMPVLAPDGATPKKERPSDVKSSASTVGFPRLSKI